MKILCVIPSLTRGGAERALSLLTHDWAKCHVVVVAAFDASRPAYDYHGRIVHLGLRLPGHALGRFHVALASTLRLIELFRAELPDRIITFMEPANFPAILASVVVRTVDRLVVKCASKPKHSPSTAATAHALLVPPPVGGGCSLRWCPTGTRGDGSTGGPRYHHPEPRSASGYHPEPCCAMCTRPVRAGCRAIDSGERVRHAVACIFPRRTPQSPPRGTR